MCPQPACWRCHLVVFFVPLREEDEDVQLEQMMMNLGESLQFPHQCFPNSRVRTAHPPDNACGVMGDGRVYKLTVL